METLEIINEKINNLTQWHAELSKRFDQALKAAEIIGRQEMFEHISVQVSVQECNLSPDKIFTHLLRETAEHKMEALILSEWMCNMQRRIDTLKDQRADIINPPKPF